MQCSVCLSIVYVLVILALEFVTAANLADALSCGFEAPCLWKWDKKFRRVNAQSMNCSVVSCTEYPTTDHKNQTSGFFLLFSRDSDYISANDSKENLKKGATWTGVSVEEGMRSEVGIGLEEQHIWSPKFVGTVDTCTLEMWLHMRAMNTSHVKVVVETSALNSWVAFERPGDSNSRWEKHQFRIGRILQEFRVLFEIVPPPHPFHLAVDDISLVECFPRIEDLQTENVFSEVCQPTQFQCKNRSCINEVSLCDINIDCPDSDDETQDYCEKTPSFARCSFESGWCGWHATPHGQLSWRNNSGPTPTQHTGPSVDHTYKNSSGVYLYVDMSNQDNILGAKANLDSPVFNPPPFYHINASSLHYNSCHITFYFHHYGHHAGSLSLSVVVIKGKEELTSTLFWSSGDQGDSWHRVVVILPNITNRYFYRFEARKGFSARGDVAIDDISLSPKCFGLGPRVTEKDLNGYNYEKAGSIKGLLKTENTHDDFVNKTFYVFSSCGAKGRFGPTTSGCSEAYNKTSVKVAVMDTETLKGVQRWTVPESGFYTIIAKGAGGGKGSNGQGVSLGAEARGVYEFRAGQQLYIVVGQEGGSVCRKVSTDGLSSAPNCKPIVIGSSNDNSSRAGIHKISDVRNLKQLIGGGGGGGASFIFQIKKNGDRVPLVIAAGAGGLAGYPSIDSKQHGHYENKTVEPVTGVGHGRTPAGPGGGLKTRLDGNGTRNNFTGSSLYEGAAGGASCHQGVGNFSSEELGVGGFGGGGGSCLAGGGGGGYKGGDSWTESIHNGEGGWSKVGGKFGRSRSGSNSGSGEVIIIPALSTPACRCDYRCIALDENREDTACICPDTWILDANGRSCIPESAANSSSSWLLIVILTVVCIFLILVVGSLCVVLYNGYQRKKEAKIQRKKHDFQLSRLRVASNSMMTEFNPNYEFGGGTYTINDLKDIPRDNLRLVKALGQGAFGEVYQGLYRHRTGDAVEMPVAVKDRPSPLIMRDLLTCAIDVAKGCKYLEENRFIHRDIAARNCLLTTKGPGRTVKIADFGMARDIYRADYYRKGGKAMLPIKWMPPEAFLDGIFTSKTDVWSFGVLLWEVMSLGYMPYTGCTNRDVMTLISSGGRLEPPSNCPAPLYAIMTTCWHPNPEERPNFGTILERLGYCIQDPDVISSPLPVFYRPPSSEHDTTIMRPASNEECIHPDYLIPLTGPADSWSGNLGQIPESKSTQPLLGADSPMTPVEEHALPHVPPNGNNNIISTNVLPKEINDKQPLSYVNVSVDNVPTFTMGAQMSEPQINC
ncbi:leukocyte tyrosine kinase receptor isoform X2 [Bemisia tabaci]|uniref:leukocyte tyrosine kinase receptor isoform X2 n=1 Tax=Bemisia tabaci TaxID=7038 RepID=UPI003B28147A